jgi:hypothetical protein
MASSRRPIVDNYDKDDKVYSSSSGQELANGETLSLEVPLCFDIGSERAIKYCQEYYITNPFKEERSEKDVPLTKILSTTFDREKERKKFLHAETSIDEKELDVALNRDDAAKQLKFTRDWLNERLFDEDTFEWHEHHLSSVTSSDRYTAVPDIS